MRQRLPLLGACKQVCQGSFGYTSEVGLLVGSTRRRRSNRPPGPGAQAARAATGRSARTCVGKPTMIRGTEVVSRPPIRVERVGRIGTGKGYSCWLSMLPVHLDLMDGQSQRWSGRWRAKLERDAGHRSGSRLLCRVRIGTMSPGHHSRVWPVTILVGSLLRARTGRSCRPVQLPVIT